MDWTAAYAAAGVFLDALCQARGIDRSSLDQQVLMVSLTDREAETTVLKLDLSVQELPADQEDDTQLRRAEEAFGLNQKAQKNTSK